MSETTPATWPVLGLPSGPEPTLAYLRRLQAEQELLGDPRQRVSVPAEPETTIGFRPVTPQTPSDEWLLVRWRNMTTGVWMMPIVAMGGNRRWWDGRRDWTPEGDEVQWCRIPGEAIDGV